MINPKELAKTSLMLLEEAVLVILYIEQSGLKPGEISNRLGISKDEYSYPGRSYPIIGSILHKLEKDGLVEREQTKYAKWRLTESERRERHKLATHHSLNNSES